jgi:hypothetical protein
MAALLRSAAGEVRAREEPPGVDFTESMVFTPKEITVCDPSGDLNVLVGGLPRITGE